MRNSPARVLLQVALARESPAGSPLLSAASVGPGNASSSAVAGALLGLALRGPAADGSCASLPSAAALAAGAVDAAQPVYVRFGEDAAVGCSLQLSAADLAAGCASQATVAGWVSAAGLASILLNATGAPALATPTHVGQLGSSDPAKAWQWLPISVTAPSVASVTWDSTAAACANVPAAASLELLWAATGEVLNPQPRIVAARLSWATSTWAAGSRAVGAAQRFSLATTVSWTQMSPVTADFVPPAPPVIPAVPVRVERERRP